MWELAENRNRCCASLYCISSCAPHLIDCTPYKQAPVTIVLSVIYPFRFLSRSSRFSPLSLSGSLSIHLSANYEMLRALRHAKGEPYLILNRFARITNGWHLVYRDVHDTPDLPVFQHNLFQGTFRFFVLNSLVRKKFHQRFVLHKIFVNIMFAWIIRKLHEWQWQGGKQLQHKTSFFFFSQSLEFSSVLRFSNFIRLAVSNWI